MALKLSVVMATRNEEKALPLVVRAIRRVAPSAEIVICDSSTDRTPHIARKLGVRVISQPPQGYGRALKAALLAAKGEIIITLDCDNTYPAEKIPEFVKKIRAGYAVVSGSRFLGTSPAAMPLMNRFGNRLFAFLVSLLYGIRVTDVTTGMRAYTREVIRTFDWTENTGLSIELIFKPAVAGFKYTEIPIDYRPRVGEVKLNPFTGGLSMLKSILKYKIIGVKKR
ncbi:MAG: glycosyltransferase family 2 protein [Candidatus Micrarchaeia archaeon]